MITSMAGNIVTLAGYAFGTDIAALVDPLDTARVHPSLPLGGADWRLYTPLQAYTADLMAGKDRG